KMVTGQDPLVSLRASLYEASSGDDAVTRLDQADAALKAMGVNDQDVYHLPWKHWLGEEPAIRAFARRLAGRSIDEWDELEWDAVAAAHRAGEAVAAAVIKKILIARNSVAFTFFREHVAAAHANENPALAATEFLYPPAGLGGSDVYSLDWLALPASQKAVTRTLVSRWIKPRHIEHWDEKDWGTVAEASRSGEAFAAAVIKRLVTSRALDAFADYHGALKSFGGKNAEAPFRIMQAADELRHRGIDILGLEWAALSVREQTEITALVRGVMPDSLFTRSTAGWTAREWGAVVVARRSGQVAAAAMVRHVLAERAGLRSQPSGSRRGPIVGMALVDDQAQKRQVLEELRDGLEPGSADYEQVQTALAFVDPAPAPATEAPDPALASGGVPRPAAGRVPGAADEGAEAADAVTGDRARGDVDKAGVADAAWDAARRVEAPHVAAARLVEAGDALSAEGVDVFAVAWEGLQGSEEEANVKTLVAVLLPTGSSTDWTGRDWGAVAVARRAGEKAAIAVAAGAGKEKEAVAADVRRVGEEFAAATAWRVAADRAGLPVRDISSLRAATRRELRDMRWEGAVDVNDAMVARYYATLTQEEAGTNERAVAFAIAGRIANHGQPFLGLPGGAARLKTLFGRARTGGGASGSQPDPDAELMTKWINNYKISLNSDFGAAEFRRVHPDLPQKAIDRVKADKFPAEWLPMIDEALGHFAPIMGARRDESSRSGTPQEINTVSAVEWGNTGPANIGRIHQGHFLRKSKALIVFTGPYKNNFTNPFDRIEGVLGTAVHEAAHGLLDYALPEFKEQFWYGVKQPIWKERVPLSGSIGHMEALREMARANIIMRKDFMEGASPELVREVDHLVGSLPDDVWISQQNANDIELIDGITRALADQPDVQNVLQGLDPLIQKNRRFLVTEQAITQYGATNPSEDLAETAKHYFVNTKTLRERAPRRAAFMDRLVEGWKTRADGGADTPAAPQRTGFTDFGLSG
ncbi:hypothetical protein, partial [Actinacidiphila glaucinigra]|uniref:hypothetical protein n=1 Tax=Actinacidiphila glaucinigra TaxID=235986 RepID=UPI0035DA47C4